jgi:hypothetical protein
MTELVKKSVLEFTTESGYDVTKYYPDPQERRTKLLDQNVRMVGSELNELLQSVMSFEEAKKTMKSILNSGTFDQLYCDEPQTLTAINEWVVKKFYELNVIFEDSFKSIHDNNMAKRWEDGKFHLRESDGKVLKPPGHPEPILVINKIDLEADFKPLNKEEVIDFVTTIVHIFSYNLGGPNFEELFSTDLHDCNMNHDNPQEVLKNQIDALIDILYYNTNTMVKLGIVY